MLRIIRVRLPTEWACHWRKLYFYLLCRVSLGLPLALSLPLSICMVAVAAVAAAAAQLQEPGVSQSVLKVLSARRDASLGFVSVRVSTCGRTPFVFHAGICIQEVAPTFVPWVFIRSYVTELTTIYVNLLHRAGLVLLMCTCAE